MKIIRAIIITSLAIPSIFVACVLVIFFAPMLAGYRVNVSSSDVAKIATERNDVSICRSILNVGFLVPTSWESRVHCVHEYASITKDPTACKGMRLDALMSCVGAAQISADACSIDYGKEVSWPIDARNNKWETETFKNCLQSDTGNSTRDSCCYLLRLTSDPYINDCSRFNEKEDFMNLCLSQLALKQRNELLCEEISDANKRDVCLMRVRYAHSE